MDSAAFFLKNVNDVFDALNMRVFRSVAAPCCMRTSSDVCWRLLIVVNLWCQHKAGLHSLLWQDESNRHSYHNSSWQMWIFRAQLQPCYAELFSLCACACSQSGAFCKVQAFIHERFKIPFLNTPPVYMPSLPQIGCGGCMQHVSWQGFLSFHTGHTWRSASWWYTTTSSCKMREREHYWITCCNKPCCSCCRQWQCSCTGRQTEEWNNKDAKPTYTEHGIRCRVLIPLTRQDLITAVYRCRPALHTHIILPTAADTVNQGRR